MKKAIIYIIALTALLATTISDFSFLGLPWDHEIVVETVYPDIAVDMTYIPEPPILWSHKQSMKYSTIKPKLITGEIKY